MKFVLAAGLLTLVAGSAAAEIRIAHIHGKTGPFEAYGDDDAHLAVGPVSSGARASIKRTIHSMSCRISETPAAIAGVLFVLSVYFFPTGIVGRLRGTR